MFKYKANVLEVLDGDTAKVLIDCGFNIFYEDRVRFFGVDTPETRTKDLEEKAEGLAVKAYIKGEIEGKEVKITTEKREKFGRYLAVVKYEKDGAEVNLNEELIEKGMAKEYFGGKRG